MHILEHNYEALCDLATHNFNEILRGFRVIKISPHFSKSFTNQHQPINLNLHPVSSVPTFISTHFNRQILALQYVKIFMLLDNDMTLKMMILLILVKQTA